MLKLFPLDIIVIIASKLNGEEMDILCQINPELSTNQEFWNRMFTFNIGSPMIFYIHEKFVRSLLENRQTTNNNWRHVRSPSCRSPAYVSYTDRSRVNVEELGLDAYL